MFTSLVWVALAGTSSSTGMLSAVPSWSTDYQAAKKQGVEQKKPLAVVIGSGAAGVESLSREGKLDPAVAELLTSQYVCVYIDATTESGKKLADALEMKQGVVLSDRSGDKQAFRHEGTIATTDLDRVLRKFSEPTLTITRTETLTQTQIRNYPAEAAPGTAAPVYGNPYSAPIGGSYCPSCRGR